MPQSIRDVMTTDPVALPATSTVMEAARCMNDRDIGDVIVLDDRQGGVCGIVTDRDITLRVVAEGKDPKQTKLNEVCSKDLVSLQPDSSVEDAIQLMRDKALRRLPVLENDKPIGIVSLGDLAEERDQRSVLADISKAPANN